VSKTHLFAEVNKKISHRKEIARQRSYHKNFGHGGGVVDPVKFLDTFDHRAKCDCCLSYCVRACRMSQKFSGRWGPIPWVTRWLTR